MIENATAAGVQQPVIRPFLCPCILADEPCHPKCACVHPHSSFACWCCAGYGSEEQRRQQANRIVCVIRRDRVSG